ncbi:phage baseplate assembly protein V [Castellaniella sp.]|uniref:phage baseplate assembly protein V n=1 Tax=Castellaniella sp. TaxID=1955812 RepID=UPI002AFE1E99|nr:phage baseplate assembly protein V [Castellaniella sp.]
MSDLVDLERRLADLERRLANIVRVGTIVEADYRRGKVRVFCDDFTTDWLPWKTRRAGGDIDWWAPEVGEQVEVIAPSGLMEGASVGPSFYSDENPEPESSPDLHTIRYKNGDKITHDRAAGSLTIKVAGEVNVDAGGPATVKTPSAKVDAPETLITGNATIEKKLTVKGGLAVSGGSGGAAAEIEGGVKVKNGDVQADDISLKGHTHTEQGDGADVSKPHP